MSNKFEARGITNATPCTAVDVSTDCSLLWGVAHQFAYMRLSEEWVACSNEVDLLDCYQTRARRIAATYARMYLETEDGFDPDKKGRFYWMALGAFASKTVACLIEDPRIQATFFAGVALPAAKYTLPPDIKRIVDEVDDPIVIGEGLGLGNLWLFMDVAVWHWAYANHPNNYFEGMNCEPLRDATELPEGGVYETVNNHLEWSSYALKKVNNLKSTKYIKKGMQIVGQIENIDADADSNLYLELQMEHLKEVANHEQLAILQPLIYDHPDFKKWAIIQRHLHDWFSPDYELVFSASCSIDDEALKSVAPESMEVEVPGTLADAEEENPKTRMGWIGQAAIKFDNLMNDPKTKRYMEGELQTIASWVNEGDDSLTCVNVSKISGKFK